MIQLSSRSNLALGTKFVRADSDSEIQRVSELQMILNCNMFHVSHCCCMIEVQSLTKRPRPSLKVKNDIHEHTVPISKSGPRWIKVKHVLQLVFHPLN